MTRLLDLIARVYQQDIVDAGKQPNFFILLSFLITFVVVRLITHAIRQQRFRLLRNLTPRGTHVHHLVWGILLLLITGYVAIALNPAGDRKILAVLFGIGAALTLDEFALWLHLEDVYWAKQGRDSIDAVVITTAILALFVLGMRFWIDAARVFVKFLGII
jgi:hypothetical protein